MLRLREAAEGRVHRPTLGAARSCSLCPSSFFPTGSIGAGLTADSHEHQSNTHPPGRTSTLLTLVFLVRVFETLTTSRPFCLAGNGGSGSQSEPLGNHPWHFTQLKGMGCPCQGMQPRPGKKAGGSGVWKTAPRAHVARNLRQRLDQGLFTMTSRLSSILFIPAWWFCPPWVCLCQTFGELQSGSCWLSFEADCGLPLSQWQSRSRAALSCQRGGAVTGPKVLRSCLAWAEAFVSWSGFRWASITNVFSWAIHFCSRAFNLLCWGPKHHRVSCDVFVAGSHC